MASLESMTGFGEARATIGGVALLCRVRSVNHRFVDIKARYPRGDFALLDIALKKRITQVFKRGAIELNLQVENAEESSQSRLNLDVARAYWQQASSLARDLSVAPPVLDSILRLPGVLDQQSGDDLRSKLGSDDELFSALIEPALSALKKARLAEGKELAKYLGTLLDQLGHHIKEIAAQEAPEKEKARAAFIERAKATLEVLSQASQAGQIPLSDEFAAKMREEAVFWIERRDFEEERVRFEMHLANVRAQLANPEDTAGRKLEFIHQELLREVNTLGTKAQSPAITSHTIEMKTILERLREQLANVC